MRIFAYPKSDGYTAIATILDEKLDPIKDINPNGILINDNDIPDMANDFFGALQINGEKIVINIEKAKEITKQRIRTERIPFLEKLDVIFQRALETGRDLSMVENEKQRLRDLPEIVNNINDLKELKDIKVDSTLTYQDLKNTDYVATTPDFVILQKQNQDLSNTVSDLTNQINVLMEKLKKKYIL